MGDKIWQCEKCGWHTEGTAEGAGQVMQHQKWAKSQGEEGEHKIVLVDADTGELMLDNEGDPVRTPAKAKKLGLIEGTLGRGHKTTKSAKSKDKSQQIKSEEKVIQVRTLSGRGEPSAILEKSRADIPIVSPLDVNIFKLIPLQTTIFNTPPLWSSFACAITYGFKGDIQEFIDLVSLDFWTGRNINPFERLAPLFQSGRAQSPEAQQQEVSVKVKAVKEE